MNETKFPEILWQGVFENYFLAHQGRSEVPELHSLMTRQMILEQGRGTLAAPSGLSFVMSDTTPTLVIDGECH